MAVSPNAMVFDIRASIARFVTSPVAVVAAYAATVLIWGTTWLGIKVSLTAIPPIAGSGFRFILAGTVLYAVAAALRVDFRRKAPPLHLVLVLAVTMFGINYALTYLAETHLASGLVAVLFGTLPFFVFGFAHFMVGERATRATIAGALLALAGVAVISAVGNVHGSIWYVLAALAASASSAYANVYLKRYADAEPFATLPPAMLLAGLGLTAWGLLFGTRRHRARRRAVIARRALLPRRVRQRARLLPEPLATPAHQLGSDGPLRPHDPGHRRHRRHPLRRRNLRPPRPPRRSLGHSRRNPITHAGEAKRAAHATATRAQTAAASPTLRSPRRLTKSPHTKRGECEIFVWATTLRRKSRVLKCRHTNRSPDLPNSRLFRCRRS
jgi:drug/metabolite transporter (DMT)-like permease